MYRWQRSFHHLRQPSPVQAGDEPPCGVDDNGQHVGMHVIGNYLDEARNLRQRGRISFNWRRTGTSAIRPSGSQPSTIMAQWEVVIGLETHVQLTTAIKIFAVAAPRLRGAEHAGVHRVDLALPGALPVTNRGAVERAVKFGLAIGAREDQPALDHGARKNYFTPTCPRATDLAI